MSDSQDEKHDEERPQSKGMARRDVIRLGAGVVATALGAGYAAAQGRGRRTGPAPEPGSLRAPGVPRPHTGPGYKYTANRFGSNGPMDDATRKIVKWAYEFNESKLTEPVVHAINRIMVDSIASAIAGFETDSVRICAKMTTQAQPLGYKSTVWGYGLSTTPELATFANSAMVRRVDLNDSNGHLSNGIPAIVAMGEALHSSGAQVMVGSAIMYEAGDLGFGEAIGPALGAAKLLGLDEDKMANALSIALTAHVALNKGVGTMSMWKGIRSAEATKCGIWSALLAAEGMTGPPQPFEGRGGWFAENGHRAFDMPIDEKLAIERKPLKASVGVTSSQQMMRLVPEIRAWTTADEIEWMECETAEFGESTDAPKWDPVNQDTGDHSRPYMLATGIIHGGVWLDSFTPDRLRDPKVRALMNKMTFGQNPGWSNSAFHVTIKKKNGETKGFDTIGGRRVELPSDNINLTDEELVAKFNRCSDFQKVDVAQRDRIRAIWGNLRSLKDIGEAVQTLAKFGQPKAL